MLDDSDHFSENQLRQRRCAPILIGFRRTTDRLLQEL